MAGAPSLTDDRIATALFRLSVGVFFLGGFVTVIVSLIVPRLTLSLDLDYARALLVQFAFHLSYLIFALPITGAIVRLGYMRAIVAGLAVMTAGCIGLVAAARAESFALMLLALLTLSAGITFLQMAVNTVVTIVGAPGRGASRLTLLQAFNSLGTVLAPLIGAELLLRGAGTRPHGGLGGIGLPFLIASAALGVLAVAFFRHRNLLTGTGTPPRLPSVRYADVARDRRLTIGVIAMFGYVGAEVTIGTLLANYLMLPATLAATPLTAGRLVALYWAGAMVGRFAGAVLMKRLAPARMLAVAAIGATGFTTTAIALGGVGGAAALIAVGLCNSIMYPTIYALALPDDEAGVPVASMLLCMAVVGGAIVPLATGALADRIGLAPALIVPAACYLAILGFAVRAGATDRQAPSLVSPPS